MELGPDRDGKAWGFGCWILGALLGAVCAASAAAAEAEAPARDLLSSILAKDGRCRHWSAHDAFVALLSGCMFRSVDEWLTQANNVCCLRWWTHGWAPARRHVSSRDSAEPKPPVNPIISFTSSHPQPPTTLLRIPPQPRPRISTEADNRHRLPPLSSHAHYRVERPLSCRGRPARTTPSASLRALLSPTAARP